MTAFDSIPSIFPDAQASTLDVPCRKCRYNLRGLQVDGRCPECGTPVAFSTHGDLLRYSDPTWVHGLRRGAIFSIVATTIGFVATLLIAFMFRRNQIAQILASFTCELLSLIGAWLLTAPDPGGVGEDKYGRTRRLIRITLFVAVANQAVIFALQTTVSPPEVRLVLQIVGSVAAVVGVVGQFAMLNYVSKLALRIPDDRIARRARFLMYAMGSTYALLVALRAWRTFFPLAARRAGGLALTGGLTVLALIVFGVMDLIMLLKLQKRFKEQAILAAQIWASSSNMPPVVQ